jgi:hypothetical protein
MRIVCLGGYNDGNALHAKRRLSSEVLMVGQVLSCTLLTRPFILLSDLYNAHGGHCLPQRLQAGAWIIPQIMPRQLPFKFPPTNYSLIITSSDTVLTQSGARLLNRILKVPGLNPGRDIDYLKLLRDFPQFIQANSGIVPRNGPWSLLYTSFQIR